jgi:hypothetical protein
MNYTKQIIRLYKSGLSKKRIIALGYTHSLVKSSLKDHTRTWNEIGRLHHENYIKNHTDYLKQSQLDFIYGSLLGDSSLTKYGYTTMFSNSHCDAQHGYSLFMRKLLPRGNIYTMIEKSGYNIGATIHSFSYRNLGALTPIWDDVMINDKKTVNERWVGKLTKEAIAYWFMDDGSSSYIRNEKSISVSFSTYAFTDTEIELLIGKFNEFGIKSTIRHSKKGPVLSVSKYDTDLLMNIIEPIVKEIPCMRYKIKYRIY